MAIGFLTTAVLLPGSAFASSTCGSNCGGTGSGPCPSSVTNPVEGYAYNQNGVGIPSQSVQLQYYMSVGVANALVTQSTTTNSNGGFCFSLAFTPVKGQFGGSGGPYTFSVTLNPITVNSITNPAWTIQAQNLKYWSATVYTSQTLVAIESSTPTSFSYYSLVDFPDTPEVSMSYSSSNSISSSVSYQFAGNGVSYSNSETWTSSWASYCASPTATQCILSEYDQVWMIGGSIQYANGGTSIAWTYVYGTGSSSGDPARTFDHYLADKYSSSSPPPGARLLSTYTLQPGGSHTDSVSSTYATSSADGINVDVGVDIGSVSLSVSLSITNSWSSSSTKTLTYTITNTNSVCHQFKVYQEQISATIMGVPYYYPGPVHIWDTGPASC